MKLKPNVRKIITVITIALFPMLMVDDMQLCFAPIYLIGAVIELANIYLLANY